MAQFEYPCHSLHIFCTIGRLSPSHSRAHTVPEWLLYDPLDNPAPRNSNLDWYFDHLGTGSWRNIEIIYNIKEKQNFKTEWRKINVYSLIYTLVHLHFMQTQNTVIFVAIYDCKQVNKQMLQIISWLKFYFKWESNFFFYVNSVCFI